MSSLSKKTKSAYNNTSTTNLTDWSKGQFETQSGGITDALNKFLAKPAEVYGGPMVADITESGRKAREIASTMNGATQVDGPQNVDYRLFDPERIKARMNPYEDQVVDNISRRYDEDLQRKIADNQARATASGAFNGSRHGVMDAELTRTSMDDKMGIVGDLRHRGYETALAADERESANLYGAGRANSDADYGARRDNAVRNDQALQQQVDMMSKLGMEEHEIEQAKLLAEKARYDERANEDWKRLVFEIQTRAGLMGSTPMLTTSTSSGTSQSKMSDPLGEFGGLMKTAGGLFDGLTNFFKPPAPAT